MPELSDSSTCVLTHVELSVTDVGVFTVSVLHYVDVSDGVGVVQSGLHQRCGHRLQQGRPNVIECTGVEMNTAR